MLNNRLTLQFALAALLLSSPSISFAAELSTLFTTPAERQIINSNRYKTQAAKPEPEPTETKIEIPMKQMIQEEVTKEYRISGITVSGDGVHTVWINSVAYEDGEKLEDNSRIKVMIGDEIRVRITAPDSKHYYATSGETLDVTYLAPIEN